MNLPLVAVGLFLLALYGAILEMLHPPWVPRLTLALFALAPAVAGGLIVWGLAP